MRRQEQSPATFQDSLGLCQCGRGVLDVVDDVEAQNDVKGLVPKWEVLAYAYCLGCTNWVPLFPLASQRVKAHPEAGLVKKVDIS